MITLTEALATHSVKLAARAEVIMREEQAGKAEARAADNHAAIAARLKRRRDEKARWGERNTREYQKWISDGAKGESPRVVIDAKAEIALASDEAAEAAAAEALAEFRAKKRAIGEEHTAADAAVKESARVIQRARLREKLAAWEVTRRQWREQRDELLGIYLADPAALSDGEWFVLNSHEYTAQELNVGLPLVGHHYAEHPDYTFDPRQTRARIDAFTAAWNKDLTALCSDVDSRTPRQSRMEQAA